MYSYREKDEYRAKDELDSDIDFLGSQNTAKSIYQALCGTSRATRSENLSINFLKDQLAGIDACKSALPSNPQELASWARHAVSEVATKYAEYVRSRKEGADRRYFKTKSHALSFITKSAPTKLVDGAWLYGILRKWPDARFQPLVQTYLEELGNGEREHNHVLIYRALLGKYGCHIADDLPDEYYLQGAIQLALGYNAEAFLPELVGYNLGYEQLPLHLLITAYEMRELGLDCYYFSLHVTIDNLSTGHAQKAIETVLSLLPEDDEGAASFYQRVKHGFELNNLGMGAASIIEQIDVGQELIQMLKRKSQFAQVHSDYCTIAGLTVNQWLENPDRIPDFLEALKGNGWIKRGRDPAQSRFWRLLQGPKAAMFGVFSPCELQLIYDWIADGWRAQTHSPAVHTESATDNRSIINAAKQFEKMFAANSCPFPQKLESVNMRDKGKDLLELMSPARHHTPDGLSATRLFSQRFLQTFF